MKLPITKITLGTCVLLSLVLSGCNTMRGAANGAGEDLNNLGNAINPPKHHTQTSTTTTVTTSQLSTKLDATNAPIQKKTTSDIPEESY